MRFSMNSQHTLRSPPSSYSFLTNFSSFLFFLSVFFASYLNNFTSAVFPEEIDALYQLYNDTDGENWIWKDESTYGQRWNFTQTIINPCSDQNMAWQGIECTSTPLICSNETCHIRGILLNKYGLNGILPSQLAFLTQLTKLDVSESNLYGPIPESIGTITSLQSLLLQINLLTKSIPESLSSLTLLTNLKLLDNYLSGTIPSSLGNLLDLNVFQVQDNYFTGTIPSEIMKLTKLQYLYLQYNLLTGSIPTSLGDLNKVIYLYMQENYLNGTIPPSIGKMTSLFLFSFDHNTLTGAVPTEIGSLTQLQYLYLQYNTLSKPLPETIGSLKSLLFCAIDHNRLTGSIPTSIGSLSRLQYLYLRYNSLSHTLPTEIGKLTKLLVLSLHMNRLTGSIPSSFGDLSSVQYLSLYSNILSHSIPSSLGRIRYLYSIALEANDLSGTIPSELGLYTRLVYMTLNLNRLTGSIPPHLGNISTLTFFNFRVNLLSGTLPSELFKSSNLVSISLQSNHFTGSIPSQIGSLFLLTDLYLQKNHFSSGFQEMFTMSTNLSLIQLDVSNNRLDGTIPSSLFQIPHLQILALTSNCFHGTIPHTICETKSIQVFYMDGLGLAQSCLNEMITFPFTNVPIMNSMEGDIPRCIWNISTMEILSLSGNALTGNIFDLSNDSHLINLTLSHNHLSGTIPLSIQSWGFQSLDLSYNKFIGTCEDLSIPPLYPGEYSNYSSITLSVNRLSGPLSQSISKYRHLDILEGNIFGCDLIPHRDETSQSYICGSIEFDQSLYTLAVIVFILILLSLLLYLIYSTKNHFHLLRVDLISCYQYITCKDIDPIQLPRLYNFSVALESVAKISGLIMIIGIICCLPIYILKYLNYGELEPEYSTHSYLYRWMWTTAYASSELLAGLLLFSWAISIFAFVYLLSYWLTQTQLSTHSTIGSSSSTTSSVTSSDQDPFHNFILNLMAVTQFTFNDAIQLFALGFINILVVGGVNAAYIIAVFRELSPTRHLLIQLGMAIFKYYWNFVCVPWLILGPLKNTRYKAGFRLTLMLINSVWVPFLVAALTSPACFRNLLIPPEEINSVYSYLTCNVILYNECIEFETFSVEVIPLSPAFSYDYLCASSVITLYLPVYIYTSCILVLIPILYTYFLVGHLNYEKLPTRIQSVVYGVAWPNAWRQTDITQLSDNSNEENESIFSNELPSPEQLLKVQTIVATLMHHVTILLTFGLCCPTLALIVTCSICISIIQWRYLVGRFVSSRLISRYSIKIIQNSPRVVDGALITLELSVGNSLEYFRATLWPVLWTSCFFFIFICWDMAGDQIGWKKSLWVPCCAICFAIFIWMILRINKHRRITSRAHSGGGHGGGGGGGGHVVVHEKTSNPFTIEENSNINSNVDHSEEDVEGDQSRERYRSRTESFQIEGGSGSGGGGGGESFNSNSMFGKSALQKLTHYSKEKNQHLSESGGSSGGSGSGRGIRVGGGGGGGASSGSSSFGLTTGNLGSSY